MGSRPYCHPCTSVSVTLPHSFLSNNWLVFKKTLLRSLRIPNCHVASHLHWGEDPAPAVCKKSTSDCLTSTVLLADGVDSLDDHVINQNGMYTVSLSAEGYKPTVERLEFNCTPGNCENCSQVHKLNMEQVFCEETHFEVSSQPKGLASSTQLFKVWGGNYVLALPSIRFS